jgi:DNA-binding MarR family transcriptional regulator/GNAT superfamily N-acetyltransferase
MSRARPVVAPEAIAQVRRLNRLVTERAGALADGYLRRGRSLGAARLLWEIGEQGADVRALRARLGLDSGYASRLLRALEAEGLATVEVSPADRRVRVARLTPAGRRERALLDRRSDELAARVLEPLRDRDRARLVAAMAEVERWLTAAAVEVRVADPESAGARRCLAAYFAELDARFDTGFDPTLGLPAPADEMRPPAGLFVIADLKGEAIGCGGLQFRDGGVAEIRRMWVAPERRGFGVGRRVLLALEARARERGARTLRLETNEALAEAIALYRSEGFVQVPAFNDERHATHWFEKPLD